MKKQSKKRFAHLLIILLVQSALISFPSYAHNNTVKNHTPISSATDRSYSKARKSFYPPSFYTVVAEKANEILSTPILPTNNDMPLSPTTSEDSSIPPDSLEASTETPSPSPILSTENPAPITTFTPAPDTPLTETPLFTDNAPSSSPNNQLPDTPSPSDLINGSTDIVSPEPEFSDATGDQEFPSPSSLPTEADPIASFISSTAVPLMDAPILISKVIYEGSDEVSFVKKGEDVRNLNLTTVAYAFYGNFRYVPCKIDWQYDPLNDIDIYPERYNLIGNIILPEGYAFEDKPLTVRKVVVIYEDFCEPFMDSYVCFFTSGPTSITVPLGTTAQELPKYFSNAGETITIVTTYGDYIDCPFTIDLTKIDTSRKGVYYPVTLILPPGVSLLGEENMCMAVYVVAQEEVVLDSVHTDTVGYLIEWLYPAENPILYVSINNQPWEEDRDNHYADFITGSRYGSFSGMHIWYEHLQNGYIYRFKLQYGDQKCTDILTLDFTNKKVPIVNDPLRGDRTGVDRGENKTPSPTKPLSSPTSHPAKPVSSTPFPATPGNNIAPTILIQSKKVSQKTQQKVFDFTAETCINISGQRLALMAEINPQYVIFYHHDASISIPTDYLKSLSFKDSDIFTIYLEKLDPSSFYISFLLNEVLLENSFLTPFVITFPWSGSNVNVVFEDQTVAASEIINQKVSVYLTATGTYRIEESPAQSKKHNISKDSSKSRQYKSSPIFDINSLYKAPDFPFITTYRKESSIIQLHIEQLKRRWVC